MLCFPVQADHPWYKVHNDEVSPIHGHGKHEDPTIKHPRIDENVRVLTLTGLKLMKGNNAILYPQPPQLSQLRKFPDFQYTHGILMCFV